MNFQGSPPHFSIVSFEGADSAVIYYLPGVAGWGNTDVAWDRPAAIWQPEIDTVGRVSAGSTGSLSGNVRWADGKSVVVEAASAVGGAEWSAVATNAIVGGVYQFVMPIETNGPRRFYRIRGQ